MPEDPPLPLPDGRNKKFPYVQWGDCSKCMARFPMTERMVWKATKKGDHRERPTCRVCRNEVKKRKTKRRIKKLKAPVCAETGKLRTAGQLRVSLLSKMHLRQLPNSGTPLRCGFTNRWYVIYFIGKGRSRPDEKRAYLEATTLEEAIAEARDWYTRALLNGAKWLPEDFKATVDLDEDILRTRGILADIRKKTKRRIAPRRVMVVSKERVIYVKKKVKIYTVKYNGRVYRRNIKTRAEAVKRADALRRMVQRRAGDPALKPCMKCGVKPIWHVNTLMHEGDDYCANMVMLRDKRFSRLAKIGLWNAVLRHGDYGGWWDFRFEHVLLLKKIEAIVPSPPSPDPLDGFEI